MMAESAPILCYAYQELKSGKIDLDSIAATEEEVRIKCLLEAMGWRFGHPDRYDQDEAWKRLLNFGKVVRVVVMPWGPMVSRGEETGQ